MGLSGQGLLAIEWTLIGIALVLIIARLNLRLNYLQLGFVLSDVFIFGAFVFAVALTAADTHLYLHRVFEAHINFEMTNWTASDAVKIEVYKILYSEYFLFYLEQYFNKGTLIALYFEIFGQHSPKIRLALVLLSIYCIIGLTTSILMMFFYCRFGCYWSLENPCPDKCGVIRDNLGWAFHFSSDLMIFALPLICISRLQMSRAQKISCGLTFCLGFINISVTFARWLVDQSVFSAAPSLTVGEALAIADGHTGLIIAILLSLRPYLRIFGSEDPQARLKRIYGDSPLRALRKETTTYQEISYPTANDSMYFGDPQIPGETRPVRTRVSVSANGNIEG